MENFEFCNPTRIIFGKDILGRIGPETRSLGKNCLLVTGRQSARKTGAYDAVRGSLEASGIRAYDLGGIQSNPILARVYEGIEIVRDHDIEFIVALGGGSVMDTAKAVAAGVLLDGDIWAVFEGILEIGAALPVICVPTLAASGSEMNGFMVITNQDTGFKLAAGSPHCYPRISFLAPELTCSVPADYTAYGGVDAICHLLEPYFNRLSNFTPVQDELTEGLIRAIIKATEGSLASPRDYHQRAALMWAATLALNGLTRAGVGDHPFPVHLIEHAISAIYGVPHGAGLAALLPGWMAWKAENGGVDRVCQFGRQCLSVSQDNDEPGCAAETSSAFHAWLKSINCPASLEDLGIDRAAHEKIAANAELQAGIWGIRGTWNRDVIGEVLSFCQSGPQG